ncbi:hypothetical protein ACFL0Y_01790 [Patescibacteria group bacterium]
MISQLLAQIRQKKLKGLLIKSSLLGILLLGLLLVYVLRSDIKSSPLFSLEPLSVLLSSFIFFVFWLIYILGYKNVRQSCSHTKTIFIFSIIFSLILIFVPIIASDDLGTYIYRSRIFSKYGQNPYLVTYDSFVHDEFYTELSNLWSGNTTVYPPLFTLWGGLVTFLAGNSLWASFLFFKMAAVLANLAASRLILALSKDNRSYYLYAFNPILLSFFLVDGHNDVYLVLFLLWSLYFLFKKETLKFLFFGWLFLFFSVMVKYFSLLAVPFYAVYTFKKINQPKQRLFFTGLILLVFTGLTVLLYAPFWDGAQILTRLPAVVQIQNYNNSSPLITLMTNLLISIKVEDAYRWSIIFSRGVFLVSSLILFIHFLVSKNRFKEGLVRSLLLVFSFFFFFFFTWFWPWYFTTVVALACNYLSFRPKQLVGRAALFALTGYGVVWHLLYYLKR